MEITLNQYPLFSAKKKLQPLHELQNISSANNTPNVSSLLQSSSRGKPLSRLSVNVGPNPTTAPATALVYNSSAFGNTPRKYEGSNSVRGKGISLSHSSSSLLPGSSKAQISQYKLIKAGEPAFNKTSQFFNAKFQPFGSSPTSTKVLTTAQFHNRSSYIPTLNNQSPERIHGAAKERAAWAESASNTTKKDHFLLSNYNSQYKQWRLNKKAYSRSLATLPKQSQNSMSSKVKDLDKIEIKGTGQEENNTREPQEPVDLGDGLQNSLFNSYQKMLGFCNQKAGQ